MMSWCRNLFADRNGAAAAEMALVMPLLVALMFGGMEAGYFLWSEHKVIKGVRDGARFAGRQAFSTVDCTSGGFTDAAVVTAIKNLTRTGTVDGTGQPTVPGWDDNATEVTVSISCDSGTTTGIYSNEPEGAPRVTVSASVSYPSLFGPIAFDLSSIDLNAEAEAAVMGL
ncbi:TadE/TadG family type IV pilus assembly protein [Aurantiacibacter gilvus]|uniref:TadE/TadG family type IV pilus assembly protein n=1 Tax=Aurantiacibacter gilvus TaxID=3139141 RepID=A0ABU9IF50_9SPHN